MFADREKFVYDCVIMDAESQNPEQYAFECFWSPTRVSTEEIARAAAAQATVESRRKYLPVSAAQREAVVTEIDAS